MARLFVSLYLFITLSLIALSAGLDQLFFDQEDVQTRSIYLPILKSAQKQELDIKQLAKDLNLPLVERSIKDIAWSESDLTKLANGQTLTLIDTHAVEHVYIQASAQVLFEISLPTGQTQSLQFFFYSLIFFIALGAAIALWIWPLWRDLSSLQKTVSHVLPDGSIAENKISKHSLIAPIAVAINDMREQISQLIQSQRELSGAVAHEFRTPLARLKFALAMQKNEHNDTYKNINQDINELERLVQEMLDYSSVGVHIPEMSLAEIPIKQLCQQIILRIENSHLQQLQVSVVGADINILADEHYIDRAISNLIINGARHAKSQLKVTILKQLDTVEINIEDDGEGVAEHLREKIFKPFYRPDESRNRIQGGAGLGLAIVKRVIDWHQGKCLVKNSTLGGANFVIQLNNPFK